jgi:molybdate transport system substrate-binding protein
MLPERASGSAASSHKLWLAQRECCNGGDVLPRRAFLMTGPMLLASISGTTASGQTILVFAAASLKNALDAVNAAFTSKTGTQVSASYAASSALIKQIENGAPAQVFLSADEDWMNYGAERNLIRKQTRVDLLGNQLVLIAAAASNIDAITIGPGFDLAALAGDGRIVTADVRSVPAGKYAKAALQSLGAWEKAAPKLAMTENVRAALTLVARGEAVLGIVYATDAKIEPKVKVIGTFPSDLHPPIVYPAALTSNAAGETERYLAFLRSPSAGAIFESFGFVFLPSAVDSLPLKGEGWGGGLRRDLRTTPTRSTSRCEADRPPPWQGEV